MDKFSGEHRDTSAARRSTSVYLLDTIREEGTPMVHVAPSATPADGSPLLSVPAIVAGAGTLSCGLVVAISHSLALGALAALLTVATVAGAALMIRP
ncbi:hypothetical protein D092_23640 [Rhodococcus ruber Chol-4]|nr:hypothetical protein CSW53_03815 [Rhodococcus ruber]KXF83820.1 hypothetical protein D092_23640 [Rhodococcus ruber Chol-4]RIK06842.1 MAG: hypothetical protein DCC47_17110 [Acidobacteriota bacterium]AWG98654.1 hypothetical protein DCN13_08805 [Rhodococcus ruber]AXY51612.1 hypothetical protein YT1_2183 [Rhodococcus ruber]